LWLRANAIDAKFSRTTYWSDSILPGADTNTVLNVQAAS
jgi:hypothetical protein